jgi:transposase-like protein
MSKRRFTKEEIEILSKNENVSKCSEKSITYSNLFKIKAVKEYKEGKSSRDIFTEAFFDLRMIGKDSPGEHLKQWNKICKTKGLDCFKKETRGRGKGGGRPKKPKDLTDTDKIKRLEAEVAYLKAENDFFMKLRAKRAERYSSRNTDIH